MAKCRSNVQEGKKTGREHVRKYRGQRSERCQKKEKERLSRSGNEGRKVGWGKEVPDKRVESGALG